MFKSQISSSAKGAAGARPAPIDGNEISLLNCRYLIPASLRGQARTPQAGAALTLQDWASSHRWEGEKTCGRPRAGSGGSRHQTSGAPSSLAVPAAARPDPSVESQGNPRPCLTAQGISAHGWQLLAEFLHSLEQGPGPPTPATWQDRRCLGARGCRGAADIRG